MKGRSFYCEAATGSVALKQPVTARGEKKDHRNDGQKLYTCSRCVCPGKDESPHLSTGPQFLLFLLFLLVFLLGAMVTKVSFLPRSPPSLFRSPEITAEERLAL